MRDRLKELLRTVVKYPQDTCPRFNTDEPCDGCKYDLPNGSCDMEGRAADHLLSGGIIVPPCKVGDEVWVIWESGNKNKSVYPANVYALRFDTKKNNMRICVEGRFKITAYGGSYTHYYNGTFAWNSVGKTVFLTREEAERALKGGE